MGATKHNSGTKAISLSDLNRQVPVPPNRGTGQTGRKLLGLAPARLPLQKKVFGTLAFGASSVPGGKTVFLKLCEMAAKDGSEICEALVEKYCSLTKIQQAKVALDDLAEALNIPPYEILGDVVKTMGRYSMNVSQMVAYAGQPDVVERLIKNAAKAGPEFHNDRKLALTATGFVQPTPLVNLDLRGKAEPAAEPDGSGMQSFEQRIKRGALAVRGDET